MNLGNTWYTVKLYAIASILSIISVLIIINLPKKALILGFRSKQLLIPSLARSQELEVLA